VQAATRNQFFAALDRLPHSSLSPEESEIVLERIKALGGFGALTTEECYRLIWRTYLPDKVALAAWDRWEKAFLEELSRTKTGEEIVSLLGGFDTVNRREDARRLPQEEVVRRLLGMHAIPEGVWERIFDYAPSYSYLEGVAEYHIHKALSSRLLEASGGELWKVLGRFKQYEWRLSEEEANLIEHLLDPPPDDPGDLELLYDVLPVADPLRQLLFSPEKNQPVTATHP
jgi:hypothetical protein